MYNDIEVYAEQLKEEDTSDYIYTIKVSCEREDLSSGRNTLIFEKSVLVLGDTDTLIRLWPEFHKAAKLVTASFKIGEGSL